MNFKKKVMAASLMALVLGFSAVSFAADATYQGASGGQPRHKDVPYFRTEDIHGMVDFISTYAGSKADSLYMSEEAFEKATGTNDKELFLIPEATHIQTYYVPEYVNKAVNKLKEFYGKHL